MVRGKISLGRAHFSRQFPGWAGPEEVDDVAIAVLPLGASGRYNDLQYLTASATASSSTGSPNVPSHFQRWIPWVETYHDDGALTSHLRLVVQDIGGNDVTISASASVTADRHISIRRPIILPEGWHVRATLAATTGAGKKLFIKYFYVDMPIGEYVAPI